MGKDIGSLGNQTLDAYLNSHLCICDVEIPHVETRWLFARLQRRVEDLCISWDLPSFHRQMMYRGNLDFTPVVYMGQVFYKCVKADYSIPFTRGTFKTLCLLEFTSMVKNNVRVPLVLPANLRSIIEAPLGGPNPSTTYFNVLVRTGSTQMPASAFYNAYADQVSVYAALLIGDLLTFKVKDLVIRRGRSTLFEDNLRWSAFFRQFCRDVYGPLDIKRVVAWQFANYNFACDCYHLVDWLEAPCTIRAYPHAVAGTAIRHTVMKPDQYDWPNDCVLVNPELGDLMLYVQAKNRPPAAMVLHYRRIYQLSEYLTHIALYCSSVRIFILLAAEPHIAVLPFGNMSIVLLKRSIVHIERGLIEAILLYARNCLIEGKPGSVSWQFDIFNDCHQVTPLIGGYNLPFVNQRKSNNSSEMFDAPVRTNFADYFSLYKVGLYYSLTVSTVESVNLPQYMLDQLQNPSRVDTVVFNDICTHGVRMHKECVNCSRINGRTNLTFWQTGLRPLTNAEQEELVSDNISAWYASCRYSARNNCMLTAL